MSGEPADFNLEDAARWRAERPPPSAPVLRRPTLRELQRDTPWVWVWCEKCQHHAPMAFVPLMIRWGVEASSDKLRHCARCSKCGHKGATLQHPSWGDSKSGFQPFPGEPAASTP